MGRDRNRYVEEVPAPSVITFNTQLAAGAATDFMVMMVEADASLDYLRHRPRLRRHEPVVGPPNKLDCKDC